MNNYEKSRNRKPHDCPNQGKREPVYIENRTSNLRMGVFHAYWVEYCPRCGENLVTNMEDQEDD